MLKKDENNKYQSPIPNIKFPIIRYWYLFEICSIGLLPD